MGKRNSDRRWVELSVFVHRGSAISTIDTPARVVEQQ